MSKDKIKRYLHINKDFWNQAVTDTNAKIAKMRDRIKSLEIAREIFRKNAEGNVPVPGSEEEPRQSATPN